MFFKVLRKDGSLANRLTPTRGSHPLHLCRLRESAMAQNLSYFSTRSLLISVMLDKYSSRSCPGMMYQHLALPRLSQPCNHTDDDVHG
ncbi:unnamed protein product [Mycena citricolor]|uniref:Uncharacterized protein n=1 Tax=Mycena citricolor TaxID=2018698 RepID=A0AAD2H611_9AGAR|nr:unnamed protein product [Mycena citricolor]